MADSTQSSQISSSQGFGDSAAGQNSAASGKASKISDSFLSSSPVTLIPSPQDERRTGQGPSTPSEGASISLRSCAQPGSSPVDLGILGPLKGGLIEGGDLHLKDENEGKAEIQSINSILRDSSVTLLNFSGDTLPSAPFSHDSALRKISPETGNIKGLEGLSDNQGSIDTLSSDGFLVFKECHYGSPLSDAHNSSRSFREFRSPDQDSPESPFEVLEESARGRGLVSEIVDITDHSQTQNLRPAPDLGRDVPNDVLKGGTGPSVPGALMGCSGRPSEVTDWSNGQAKPPTVKIGSEFLTSASKVNKLDPSDCGVQKGASGLRPWESSDPPLHLEPSSFIPPHSSQVEDDPWKSDQDEAEILDVDSSEDSDDTVIEDTSDRLNLSKNVVCSISSLQPKVEGPTEPDMRPVSMALSCIKETNEHNLIEEEGEYEIVKEHVREASSRPEVVQIPGCDKSVSDLEPSVRFTSDFRHLQQHSEPLQADSVTSHWHQRSKGQSDTANSEKSIYSSVAVSSKEIPFVPSKELDLDISRKPDANIVGSDSVNKRSSHNPPNYSSLTEEWKPDEMHDLSKPKCVEQFSEDLSNKRPPTLQAGPLAEKMSSVTKAQPANTAEIHAAPPGLDWSANPRDEYTPQAFPKPAKHGSEKAEDSPETASDPESIELECSVSAATDSFVGFMRECLNSRQPKESDERYGCHAAEQKPPQLAAPFSGSPPAVLLNLEQERLTICALKELGSSQEEADDLVRTAAPQTGSEPQTGPIAPFAPKPPSPPLNTPPSEALPGRDVEGADANEAELAARSLELLLTHLSVRELLYWRDPRKSGVVFGTSLLVLLSLATFSVISVVSYLLLALLCVTITFRVYKSVIQAVQKSSEGHPFKALMEKDINIPPETFRKYTDMGLSHLNQALKQIRRLFLVEDLVDSLKLAVVMWLLTYVGAIFNGITLLILADILLFSSPLVYEKNKTQIDHYVGIVRTQVEATLAKLQEKLPGAVKRSKAE
ncbi:uncharacterized protein LOC135263553 isoform X2 [Anguilla rostrata]|uniref:uncharacterized protein LOC135263553 isoform X2 n=1 Tax=Anguilla rostrata TaxID=7938 RepID=UPI0030CAEA97